MIHNFFLRDLAEFFNRRELVSLSYVSRQFRRVIEHEFRKSPYESYYMLQYQYGLWKLIRHSGPSSLLSTDELRSLAACKYVRFWVTCIKFGNVRYMNEDVASLDVLNSIKHVWQDSQVEFGTVIALPSSVKRLLLSFFSGAHQLQWNVPNSLSDLVPVLTTDRICTYIHDSAFTTNGSVACSDIVEFLMRSARSKLLSIYTTNVPDLQECEKMLDVITEKFMLLTEPNLLHFRWNCRRFSTDEFRPFANWHHNNNFDVTNKEIKMQLVFKSNDFMFSLSSVAI
ncbi:hypothetical protein Ddc_02816 [Ditylenchus destructor]|nr:hypothetical protein Ddc_02816 [Ditylenchus destructor]